MRAAVWITLVIVLVGSLNVEGRASKRKFLKTSGEFDIKEKEPMEGSNRQARQGTNCIITGNRRSARTYNKTPQPAGSPTCIIIAPPPPVPPPVPPPPPTPTTPTTTTTPPPVPSPPPPSPTSPPPTTPPTTSPTTTAG